VNGRFTPENGHGIARKLIGPSAKNLGAALKPQFKKAFATHPDAALRFRRTINFSAGHLHSRSGEPQCCH